MKADTAKDLAALFTAAVIAGWLLAAMAWGAETEETPCTIETAQVILTWHKFDGTPVSEIAETPPEAFLDVVGEIYAQAVVTVLAEDNEEAAAFVHAANEWVECMNKWAEAQTSLGGL